MGFRWLLPLLLVVFGLAAMAACGDGDEPADEEAQRLLEQIVLKTDDLPIGMQQVSASFSTNQEVAEAQFSPDEELLKLERWGRRLGYDLFFQPLPDAPADLPNRGVQSAASLYDTVQGAIESFAEGVADARAVDSVAAYPELSGVEVVEIDRPDIGDEVFWLRASGVQSQPENTLLVDDQVALRVGASRAFLRVVTVFDNETDRTVYMDQVEEWALLVARRMSEVLGADEGS